ncbi:DUF4253 domain-containing protein [Streptomyces griseus]|uniref:DUF4253 domain-containing protein n=1 Tax=Streptomyces griseus TaxID=1911 RepID=UPI0013B64F31|nr:DUF4253 domain-containing protein [Streptomyces griseus]
MSAIMRVHGFGFSQEQMRSAVSAGGVRVVGFPVRQPDALEVWQLWLSQCDITGRYPIVTPCDPSDLVSESPGRLGAGGRGALAAAMARDPDEVVGEVVAAAVSDTLAKANKEDVQEWLDELVPERLAAVLKETAVSPREGDIWEGMPLGNAPELWLCLVEAEYGHEIPALLPGLPDAPNWWSEPARRLLLPSDHVAFLHSWHKRFGADLFFLDGRRMRLVVRRPPLAPCAAAQAAVERFAYCSDGLPDLPVLGDNEVRSTAWRFWWD